MLAKSIEMLLRRLPLVILAFLIALGVGVGAAVVVPPTQQSVASVLLVPALKQPGVAGPTNPLLSLGGSLSIVASVLQISVSDDETLTRLADAGYTANYEVAQDLSENSGPVLLITAEDTRARTAQATKDALVGEIEARLKLLQDQRAVPEDLRVSAITLTSSLEPKVVHKPQVQASLVSAAATLVLLLLTILMLERRSEGRRVGRHDEQAWGEPDKGHRAAAGEGVERLVTATSRHG